MSESQDRPMRFRGGFPIPSLVWAGLALVVSCIISAVFVGVVFGEAHSRLSGIILFALTFLVPILICVWPRPRFVRQITIHLDALTATDWRGKTTTIPAADLLLISAESTVDWETQSTNPWGRLYLRGRGSWIALKLHFAEAPECYREIVRRFPHVLGIPGKGELDLPAISDPAAFASWAESVRTLARREIRRQVAFNLLNAMLLAFLAGVFIVGLVSGLAQGQSLPMGLTILAVILFGALGGAASFIITVVRRERLLRHVLRELNRRAMRALHDARIWQTRVFT